MDAMNDGEREFSLREVFRETFIGAVLLAQSAVKGSPKK